MMRINDVVNFFSPFSDKFEAAIEDFHLLSNESYGTLKKAAVIGLSILGGLGTFYILFVGAFPAFRWAVNWLKGEGKSTNMPRPGGNALGNAHRAADEPDVNREDGHAIRNREKFILIQKDTFPYFNRFLVEDIIRQIQEEREQG